MDRFNDRQKINNVGIRTVVLRGKGSATKVHCGSRYAVLYFFSKSSLLKIERWNGAERIGEDRVCRSFEAQGKSTGLDTRTALPPL